jgi:5-dehydro-2-deoxygluconokinase
MKSLFPQDREYDIIPFGRIGIDLNANEIHRPMEETETFTKYVGGSAANIAIGMARLGKKVGFIGRVSDDQFGRFALNYFKNEGIDTTQIAVDPNASMGLAFTEIKSPTESSILMYRNNVADLKIESADISEEYIKNAKSIVITGTALAASPSREAVFVALEYARKHGTTVIFDVDYRPYTWKNEEETAVYYNLVGMKSDIIIGSREEFDLLEKLSDPENTSDEVTSKRWFDHGVKVCVIKHGKDGSTAYTPDGSSYDIKSFPVELLKSFGGGDAYASAFFYGLLENWEMIDALEFGSASAAMLVASHSCSDAMPTVNAIKEFIREKKEEFGEMVARAQ